MFRQFIELHFKYKIQLIDCFAVFLVKLPDGYQLPDDSDSETGVDLSMLPTHVLEMGVASDVTVPTCAVIDSKSSSASLAKKKKKSKPEMSHYRTHKRRRRIANIVPQRVRQKTGNCVLCFDLLSKQISVITEFQN